MNNLVCSVICLIVGILIYIEISPLFSVCRKKESIASMGKVHLEKCCPLEYMWSENQKKCIKICEGCAIGAYGDINYEFFYIILYLIKVFFRIRKKNIIYYY